MRSNIDCWKALQASDYFERHPLYNGFMDMGPYDIGQIEHFVALGPEQVVVVIGCGYGREAAHICKRVSQVYGIDVSERILDKAVAHLGVANFRPVFAERYADEIPAPVDLVYSVAVMQHLTRDIVHDYLLMLGRKLAADGRMVIQFLESDDPRSEQDADVSRVYEPSVSWSIDQIVAACVAAGLRAIDIKTEVVRPGCAWHWAFIGPGAQ